MNNVEMEQFRNVLNTLITEGVIKVKNKSNGQIRFESNGLNMIVSLNTTFDVALKKLTSSINFSRKV